MSFKSIAAALGTGGALQVVCAVSSHAAALDVVKAADHLSFGISHDAVVLVYTDDNGD
ncbi:MAG: hypothetical protein OXP75_14180 [Rhodospirillales bacterium]|nr:hypothetical protein [Rhodospirillales bacterium]